MELRLGMVNMDLRSVPSGNGDALRTMMN